MGRGRRGGAGKVVSDWLADTDIAAVTGIDGAEAEVLEASRKRQRAWAERGPDSGPKAWRGDKKPRSIAYAFGRYFDNQVAWIVGWGSGRRQGR